MFRCKARQLTQERFFISTQRDVKGDWRKLHEVQTRTRKNPNTRRLPRGQGEEGLIVNRKKVSVLLNCREAASPIKKTLRNRRLDVTGETSPCPTAVHAQLLALVLSCEPEELTQHF